MLHSFFEEKTGEKSPCVLVVVDANIMDATKIGISAYTSSNMNLKIDTVEPKTLGKVFNRYAYYIYVCVIILKYIMCVCVQQVYYIICVCVFNRYAYYICV